MNFFRKLWQDLKNGEPHSGSVAWELLSLGFVLLLFVFVVGEKLIAYLLH